MELNISKATRGTCAESVAQDATDNNAYYLLPRREHNGCNLRSEVNVRKKAVIQYYQSLLLNHPYDTYEQTL